MPRITRIDIGNHCYHVINRANARLPIFFKEKDYVLFENVLEDAQEKFSMRILAYCLMPNHFHIVLYPWRHEQIYAVAYAHPHSTLAPSKQYKRERASLSRKI